MPNIILGPVLGLVTERSARILIETDTPGELQARVCDQGGRVIRTLQLVSRPPGPLVFNIDGLIPRQRYTVIFNTPEEQERRAYIRPFTHNHMRIAGVSCFDIRDRPHVNLWSRLAQLAKRQQLDAIFHMGDQIYADGMFADYAKQLGRMPRSSWPTWEAILCDSYRALYRTYWNHADVRQILCRVSNLMIWDDHEVTDAWGDRALFADPNRVEHFIARCAWKVYHEYQRQLWDPRATTVPIGRHEGYHQCWGPIAAIFIDVRGSRGFRRYRRRNPNIDNVLLSTEQWNSIQRLLVPRGGPLGRVQALMIVSSVPVVYAGKNAIEDLAVRQIKPDVLAHWSYRSHGKEQFRLLSLLRNWKEAMPGREVLLLGGDVHFGGEFDITYGTSKGPATMKQVISSPIYRKREPGWAFSVVAPYLRSPLEERCTEPADFHWRAHKLTRNLNYLLVDARASAVGACISARIHG